MDADTSLAMYAGHQPSRTAIVPEAADGQSVNRSVRRLYYATQVRSKRLVVLAEGAGHGWELLGSAAASDWSPLAVTVAAWTQGPHR